MWFTKKQHSATTKSLVSAAFPEYLRDDVMVALKAAGIAIYEPFVDPYCKRDVDGCSISIPYRVHFPPACISDINTLNERQRIIFAAFMTRHHDGHQREYWARVLCTHPASWTAPYLAALLGDYVIQVLEAVRVSLADDWVSMMEIYASENQICLRSLNHRILEYWTIYYRYSSPNIRFLTDYPGYIIADQLGFWDRRTAPKLLRKAAQFNKTRMATPTSPIAIYGST